MPRPLLLWQWSAGSNDMRIVRFHYKDQIGFGCIEDKTVRVIRDLPFPRLRLTETRIPLPRIKLLAPTNPSKIVLVGLNYRDHARELGMAIPNEPVIFLKPPTAVIGPAETIDYPRNVSRLDYEAELAVVIKKTARNILKQQAKKHILGYTCLNDVTARDLQKKDIQWTRAKSFDTFCPLGPWIETELEPDNVRVFCALNGTVKQDSSTANFIFPVDYLVSFISRVMTLYPGDVISTGTPPGVGPMRPGDTVEITIAGIGTLRNSVKKKRS